MGHVPDNKLIGLDWIDRCIHAHTASWLYSLLAAAAAARTVQPADSGFSLSW